MFSSFFAKDLLTSRAQSIVLLTRAPLTLRLVTPKQCNSLFWKLKQKCLTILIKLLFTCKVENLKLCIGTRLCITKNLNFEFPPKASPCLLSTFLKPLSYPMHFFGPCIILNDFLHASTWLTKSTIHIFVQLFNFQYQVCLMSDLHKLYLNYF